MTQIAHLLALATVFIDLYTPFYSQGEGGLIRETKLQGGLCVKRGIIAGDSTIYYIEWKLLLTTDELERPHCLKWPLTLVLTALPYSVPRISRLMATCYSNTPNGAHRYKLSHAMASSTHCLN